MKVIVNDFDDLLFMHIYRLMISVGYAAEVFTAMSNDPKKCLEIWTFCGCHCCQHRFDLYVQALQRRAIFSRRRNSVRLAGHFGFLRPDACKLRSFLCCCLSVDKSWCFTACHVCCGLCHHELVPVCAHDFNGRSQALGMSLWRFGTQPREYHFHGSWTPVLGVLEPVEPDILDTDGIVLCSTCLDAMAS